MWGKGEMDKLGEGREKKGGREGGWGRLMFMVRVCDRLTSSFKFRVNVTTM
jgi:hypothetical protein